MYIYGSWTKPSLNVTRSNITTGSWKSNRWPWKRRKKNFFSFFSFPSLFRVHFGLEIWLIRGSTAQHIFFFFFFFFLDWGYLIARQNINWFCISLILNSWSTLNINFVLVLCCRAGPPYIECWSTLYRVLAHWLVKCRNKGD